MGGKPRAPTLRPYVRVRAQRTTVDVVVVLPRGYRGYTGRCRFRYYESDAAVHRDLPQWRGPRMAVGEVVYTEIYWGNLADA